MSNTCPSLNCVPPVDLSYSLQNLPPVPVVFGNQQVQWCCPSGLIGFTGTLPTWITVDGYSNCLIGMAGVYHGATQAEADANAQASIDNFAAAALASGDLSCKPPLFCKGLPTLNSNLHYDPTGPRAPNGSAFQTGGNVFCFCGSDPTFTFSNATLLDASSGFALIGTVMLDATHVFAADCAWSTSINKFVIAVSSGSPAATNLACFLDTSLGVTSVALGGLAGTTNPIVSVAVDDTHDRAYFNNNKAVESVVLSTQLPDAVSASAPSFYYYAGKLAVDTVSRKVFAARARTSPGVTSVVLDILDGATLAISSSVVLDSTSASFPQSTRYNCVWCPDNGLVYVAGVDSSFLSVIWVVDPVAGTVVTQIPIMVMGSQDNLIGTSGIYDHASGQIFLRYNNGTNFDLGIAVFCVADNTQIGTLSTAATGPGQPCVVGFTNQLAVSLGVTFTFNLYDWP